jgi:ABC-type multidrug transport system fused ATPase/permease subunit
MDNISFVLYSTFVGASFGGIAELYAQIKKRLAQQKSFELLGETSEKINLIETCYNRKNKRKRNFNNVAFSYPSEKKSKY